MLWPVASQAEGRGLGPLEFFGINFKFPMSLAVKESIMRKPTHICKVIYVKCVWSSNDGWRDDDNDEF